MKEFALAAVFGLLGTAVFADPIEGVWQTQPDEGVFAHVSVAPCDKGFCGTITRTFKGGGEFKSPNIGKQIVIGMIPQGGGSYKGRVLRPADNKVYSGKATVSGNSMSLSGCVAGGLICKSQNWSKLQ
ncbi:MAG: DUF2147 domain-containing protein [Paracoccus sp. (in: a-proteobacteria)]